MARCTSSWSSSSSSKRQKRNAIISKPRRKQHLYLALDDWEGGYSIHKIDADEIMDDDDVDDEAATAIDRRDLLHKFSEPAALRLASPVVGCLMGFASMGSNIFVATNPRCMYDDDAPKLLVYDAETGALSGGQRLPHQDKLYEFGPSALAMAVGERLYLLTSIELGLDQPPSFQALSWAPTTKRGLGIWDPRMEWSWSCLPPPRGFSGYDIATYALHPDGRTIFISTTHHDTHAFDTGNGVWTELGNWVLPFRGQAYFDAELDAWVGLHHKEDGYVCCCPVASRTATAMGPPECSMLKEKLFGKEDYPIQQRLKTTLTYMGDSRFCLIENVMPRENDRKGAVLHVTLFGLKYDHKGELQTKIRRKTRSYAVSKYSAIQFSHAAFWM